MSELLGEREGRTISLPDDLCHPRQSTPFGQWSHWLCGQRSWRQDGREREKPTKINLPVSVSYLEHREKKKIRNKIHFGRRYVCVRCFCCLIGKGGLPSNGNLARIG